MFLDFYKLKEQPFGVTPDPRFLYLTPSHREALASLYYGVETGRGFLSLIAKPGMGKTTLLFHLLEKFGKTARTAFLFQTQCNSREFLRFLLAELGCDTVDQDFVRMHDEFNKRLLQEARAGRRFIVVIDEAQNLSAEVLETVRLLSDFETPRAKLMQIILAGQPELADKLSSRGLAQLRQRISICNTLEQLPEAEVVRYIEHRMRVAGYAGGVPFTADALALIASFSEGTPRNINNLCFNSLSLGCALKQQIIPVSTVEEVISDLDLSRQTTEPSPFRIPAGFDGSRFGLPNLEEEALALAMGSVGSSVPKPMKAGSSSGRDEVLSPAEARAYMQQVIQLLRNRR